MPSDPLCLEVAEFADADHWRWVLREAGGAFLAHHWPRRRQRQRPAFPAMRAASTIALQAGPGR